MERHYVTAVFSDLSNATPLAQTEDPEIVAGLQSRIRRLAQELAEEHLGVVNQHYGDGILTIFGLPEPREDDVIRAVEYVLALHSRVPDIARDLAPVFDTQLHSGIDSGLVAASLGTLPSGVYEVFGDPLNTAARLSDAAAAGQVVANTEALGLAVEFFQTEAHGELTLKGIEHPVRAVRVLGRNTTATRYQASMRRGLTRFCGRRTEMLTLQQALDSARGGHLQLVSVVGESGVGKSRLVAEFLGTETVAQSVTLSGQCNEQSAAPLQPFLDMLRSQLPGETLASGENLVEVLDLYLESINTSLTGHTQTLSAALGTARVQSQASVVKALEDWFCDMCRKFDIVAAIDDWQWADDASRELLSRLLNYPIHALLVLGCRQVNSGDPAERGTMMRLPPFSAEETDQTVNHLLPLIVQPGIHRLIRERSGGNPLFIEELCRSVQAQHGQGGMELPATISGLIEAKTKRLSEAARQTVFACAVIGQRIPVALLTEIVGSTQSVAELVAADILYAVDVTTLEFNHGLTREVVHSIIPLQQLRRLHEQAAQTIIEQCRKRAVEEPVEVLARHYAQSRNYAQMVVYAAQAGDKALSTNTLDRARYHYQNGIEAMRRLPREAQDFSLWLQLSTRLALACTYAPSQSVVDILLDGEQWAEQVGDEAARAQVEYYLGWLYYAMGRQKEALRYSRISLQRAEALGAQKLRAQLFACIGQSAAAACDYPLADEYLDLAIDIKANRGAGKHPPIGWAYAVSCKALVVGDQGDFEQAAVLMETALQRVRGSMQAIEASVANSHNTIRSWRGRWQELIDGARAVQGLCERYSLPYVYASSRSSESYARWILYADPDALDILREATRQMVATEMELYVSLNCGWVADALSRAGAYGEAAEFGQLGLKYVAAGDRLGEAMILRALHRVAVMDSSAGLGDPQAYLQRAYAAAAARASKHEQAVTRLHEAVFTQQQGGDGWLPLVEQAVPAFRQMGMHWHLQQAQQLTSGAPVLDTQYHR